MTRYIFTALCCAVTSASLLLAACTTDDSQHHETVTTRSQNQMLTPQSILTHETLTRSASADASIKVAQHILPAPAFSPALALTPATERYVAADDNKVMQTADKSVSTFSIDVDTGSYANVRRFLQHGTFPPADAVRVEEMLNYFSYDYPAEATIEQPFSVVTELGVTPWNTQTKLLHIGLQGYVPPSADTMQANLVFLIDVSGSMQNPDKLGLLKSSIRLLTNELDSKDTVSIVVYAGSSGIVLPPTPGDQHAVIHRALSQLQAGGSTHGSQGIQLAYQLAADNFVKKGINRIILATDGDFNVGISDTEQLKQLIAQKRESGIALTTLGFGTGNYNDHLMEQLADIGDGTYAYIDTLTEARKVLVDERNATMLRIAGDVKIQIEFNPQRISEYRLIGYTNRLLANEDFNNDKVDAGDIGAGHTVTALYEIALRGEGGERVPTLRYQKPVESYSANYNDELAEIRLRYKLPGEQQSRLISETVHDSLLDKGNTHTSDNFRFSASVAALGQLLRGNQRMNGFGYLAIRDLAVNSKGDDSHGYRGEFIRLVDLATSLDKMHRASNGVQSQDEG